MDEPEPHAHDRHGHVGCTVQSAAFPHEEVPVYPAPVVERVIALTLVPGESSVHLLERHDLHVGHLDYRLRLATPVDDHLTVTGARGTTLDFPAPQQAGRRPLSLPAH